MLLKLRPYSGQQEASVDVSKSALVSTLLAEACKAFQADSANIDLIFCGQILTEDTPLLICKLKDNDVIGVRIKNCNPSPVKKRDQLSDSQGDENTDDESNSTKHFEIGDNLYYEDAQTGQWREASLVSVERSMNENTSPNQTNDEFVYTVYDGELNVEKTVSLSSLRPCGCIEYKFEDLAVGMEILAYCGLRPGQLGWYRVIVTSVSTHTIIGTIHAGGADKCYPKEHIKFCYRTIQFPKLVPRVEWKPLTCDLSLLKPCMSCKSHPTRLCRDCSCVECGGKHDEEKQLLCEECEDAYHMGCVDPPVLEMPEGEWFCPDCCHKDEDLEKRANENKKRKIEKATESISKALTGRDWGKGLGTAAVSDKFCVVPKEHFGKIPGVPSGRLWASRVDVCRYGVHRPPVAGICGTVNTGVQSVCFSGGYEGDYDHGFDFVMSGSGGRDLSDNRRINKQSFSQTLTSTNLALAQSCYAPINSTTGATALSWRRGLPIRVIRGYKLAKVSQFAPKEGYRYDGIYKVVKYYKEDNNGNVMWKFHLRRDDNEPAPWTASGQAFMREMSVGFLEGILNKADDGDSAPKTKSAKKRKWCSIDEAKPALPKKVAPYIIRPHIVKLIEKDDFNERNWDAAKESINLGYPCFIRAIAEHFCCTICQDVVKDPFTPTCGHNTCLKCARRWLKESGKKLCPFCHLEIDIPVQVNQVLDSILQQLLPGYNRKFPLPQPYSLVKK